MTNLRETKKSQTKAAIQQAALQLFSQRGYAATTVEAIAAAANVSPSTFFRYFATKEAVVLYDSLDPLLIEAFKKQPATLSSVQALSNSIKEVFGTLPPDRLKSEEIRSQLIRTIPALYSVVVDEFARNITLICDMIAERSGRSVNDPEVRTLAGAIIGVGLAILAETGWDPHQQTAQRLAEALHYIDSGWTI